MEILKLTAENQQEIMTRAIQVLKKGGLVVYPTETTYGIGADCENPVAIARLLAYKSKRDGKPLSVAVADKQMAQKYVSLNKTAEDIYGAFLPGPVTVISKGTGLTAPGVASGTGSLGIRIPAYPFMLDLIRNFGKGITATGANASYQKRPYKIADVLNHTSGKQKELIDLVIDAGELPRNEPSTVIDTTIDDVQVMRRGKIGFNENESVTSQSAEQTKKLAADLIAQYRSSLTYKPLIFALTGEMGAGKTQFAKGLGAGLGLLDNVTSPTFSLENEYHFQAEGRKGLFVHIDTWRMESAEEFQHLGIEKLISQNAVIAIEWADRFAQEVKTLGKSAHLIWVDIVPSGENERKISYVHPSH